MQDASERPREHFQALRRNNDSFPGSVNYTARVKLYVTGVDKACKPAGKPSHYLTVTEAVFFFLSRADPLISLLEERHSGAIPSGPSMVSNLFAYVWKKEEHWH